MCCRKKNRNNVIISPSLSQSSVDNRNIALSPVLALFLFHVNSIGSCHFVVINLLMICLFHLTLKAEDLSDASRAPGLG